MSVKKKVVLVFETPNWAFHSISKQIAKHLGDRYDFQLIAREDSAGHLLADVAVYFWWHSALRGRQWIKARRTCIGMYDHWSIAKNPNLFPQAVDMADCLFGGNEQIVADLCRRAPGKQIELTEDGVDLGLFTPQPFPAEFTVGWTGNRVYKQIGMGDFKGVDLIEEAAKLAGVKLLLQDKQVKQIPQEEMPETFYRNISCYCCASIAEGTPCPALESLACGRLLVSTAVGIVPKLKAAHPEAVILTERTPEAVAAAFRQARDRSHDGWSNPADVRPWDWANKVKAFIPVMEGG